MGLELPQSVVAAINRKVEQYYLVQEYAFRVDREKKESERKRIEAEGLSAFQQIVSQGISDSYVRWRGIEATLQLAQSPNSKIVIIGSGKDGLPIILGNVDTPTAPRTSAGQPSDNSEAATTRPMGASPPLLEKTPASNLASPPEQSPPTAVPRAPAGPATGSGAPGNNPSGAGSGKQSSAPAADQRSSWTPTLEEIQAIVSRMIGSSEPAQPAPEHPPHPGGHPAAGPGPTPGAPPPSPPSRPAAERTR